MIIPDANLLIYAYDAGSPWHNAAAAWWTDTLNGSERVGLPWLVVLAFARISTNTTINANPLTANQVHTIIEQWEQTGVVEYIHPGMRHRSIMFGLLAQAAHSGNMINDAHLAALSIEAQATIYSNDRDFGLFPGVRWINPLVT
jgi:hypothetical protein